MKNIVRYYFRKYKIMILTSPVVSVIYTLIKLELSLEDNK